MDVEGVVYVCVDAVVDGWEDVGETLQSPQYFLQYT